ncbi:NADPH:quinone reductase-like Zn-dependent oxidoreductase [Bradyrhizobium ottawaense]
MTHAIRFHKTGGPEVLVWEEVSVGKPGPGEARIRHTAVGLNFVDIYNRSGLYPAQLPSGLGSEAAGVVEEVGPGVTDLKPGDRVAYGASPLGAYSEARLIPADRLLKLPEGVDDRTAAAMMLKGLTTQYLIRQTYRVKAGDTILLHAAAGGVGLILSQWAKHLGATVIGTVSNDEKAKLAKAHGCDHVIIYTREDFVKRVDEITGGKKVPVVYDSVGKDTFLKSLDCLAPLGVAALFGQSSGRGRAAQSRPAGPEGLALRHAADIVHLRRQARKSGRDGERAVRRRQVRCGQDRGAPDLSVEGRRQGACRSRRTQDHGIDRPSGVMSGPASRPFMLAHIAGVIEVNCLEVDVFGRDPGQGGLGQDRLGDVLDRTPGDLVYERDIPVFARGDAGDDLTPCDFGVDDRLAAPPSIVDHHDEILHQNDSAAPPIAGARQIISEKQNQVKADFEKAKSAAVPMPYLPFLRGRADLARSRSSWPLGMDRQISPTQSSFTPTIGLALKLVRLTTDGLFPRSIVFK